MSDTTVWLEFLSPENLCGLCGNSGWVDTRGHVRSAAGVSCGVRRFCICPNGRALRDASDLLGKPPG